MRNAFNSISHFILFPASVRMAKNWKIFAILIRIMEKCKKRNIYLICIESNIRSFSNHKCEMKGITEN